MGEMIENMRMLRQANKEYRQDLGRKRIYLFKRHVEAEILNETEYSIRSVSYTHLDVYKRQMWLFPVIRNFNRLLLREGME